MKISIVIPALNEEAGIGAVIDQVPQDRLQNSGYQIEIIVVDNGSTDRTAALAASRGAKVIKQPLRGYGNAYKAGFASAGGDIIVTGDADMTYPFDAVPELVDILLKKNLDFLNTNRLSKTSPALTMAYVHAIGTWVLSFIMQMFFECPFRDSQSGMWIFRREILQSVSPQSSGMPFSQEIKIEAFTKGFKCDEVAIEYRSRVGESKLNPVSDGLGTLLHLVRRRFVKQR